MSFFSIPFLGLVLGSLVLYYLLPGKARWMLLLGASLGFYLWGGLWAGAYLAFAILTTYWAGMLLGRLNRRMELIPRQDRERGLAALRRRKRWVLAACLTLNFGLLFLVKYWDFAAGAASRATGLALPRLELTVPLGLGIMGVWASMWIEWAVRALCLKLRFNRGKWTHKAAQSAV